MTAVEGQSATLHHPAGPVQGTITRATPASVWFTFTRADGTRQTLRFTQRKDGKWQQAGTAGKGKGSFTGHLTWEGQ